MLSSFNWKTLARKNIKKQKRLVFCLRALFLLKNIFCLYFSPIAKLWPRKKAIFKVFVFWRYSKTYLKEFLQKISKVIFLSVIWLPQGYSWLTKATYVVGSSPTRYSSIGDLWSLEILLRTFRFWVKTLSPCASLSVMSAGNQLDVGLKKYNLKKRNTKSTS